MNSLRAFLIRILNLFRRNNRDLDSELGTHLDLAIDQNLRACLSPAEARRQALLQLGGVEQTKEHVRDARTIPWLADLPKDFRYALRQLRFSPGFTITAILTLALGIGATTAIFTLVDAVLLRSLPVSDPAQLYRLGKDPECCVHLGFIPGGEYALVSNELYEYFRANTNDFEELSAFEAGGTFLGVHQAHTGAPAKSYFGEFVSGNYFSMFGLRPYSGRLFSASDDSPTSPPVAVMSYHVWKQIYNLDPSVVGALFNINNHPFTIIGITPPQFYGDNLSTVPPDFYLPLATEPLVKADSSLLKMASAGWLNMIGRIRPGADAASTEAQMRVELQQWLRSHSADMNAEERSKIPTQSLSLGPGGAGITYMRQQYGDWLRILMLITSFVLLIVCANVANLLLLRGMERRQQTSLRIALGAPPVRLVRQALTESILLSLMGGLVGLLIAFLGTRLILHFAFPTTTEVPISPAPSLPILFFALAVSFLTGIFFGIGPAYLATRVNPIEALRGANRLTKDSASFPRKALVIFQAALSVVVLSVSGLLLQTLHNLEHENFGFDRDHRTIINIDPALAGYTPVQLPALYTSIHDSLAALPGVSSVAFALYSPMSGDNWTELLYIDGKPAPTIDSNAGSAWARVSPGFFDTIGNPILRGRTIDEHDTEHTLHVAVINEALAKKFFPNQDPLGKHFGKSAGSSADYEIVGVAKDARYSEVDFTKPAGPFFFIPQAQTSVYDDTNSASTELRSHYLHDVIVRTQPGATLPDEQLWRAIASAAPDLPVGLVRTMNQQVETNFSQQKLIAQLSCFFGVLALVLASIGISGITSYNVARRTNEIGVRMALGANRSNIARLVLRGSFLQVLFGLFLGLPLAFAAGRLLASQLYQIRDWDPAAPAIAIALLSLFALLASLIPAQKAASLDPVKSLRAD